jgi:hypothetical protein
VSANIEMTARNRNMRPPFENDMSRTVFSVVCVALLVACQPAAQQSSATTAGAVSPSPQSSPQRTLKATSTPSAPVPSPMVSLNCRLPVVALDQTTYSFSGGFVTFPRGALQEDPASFIMSIGDGELGTQAKPVLRAYSDSGPPFYDLAVKRWVPVGAAQASADGSTYAFISPPFGGSQSPVSVVTIATGTARVFDVGTQPWTPTDWFKVGDFDGRYVYLLPPRSGQLPQGVWRLDTASGSVVQLSQQASIFMVRFPWAWVGRVNPHDPSPPTQSQGGALFDSLVQVNLTTGAETTWIYRPGESVALMGLDGAGDPVVSVSHRPDFNVSTSMVMLLGNPGDSGIQISSGAVPLSMMQADVGRIWFGSAQGIYLWTPVRGLQVAFPYGQPIMPAGHCV